MRSQRRMEALKLYAELMEEVKLRLTAIEMATMGRTNLGSPFVREFCYLQLRMICELIALGCLTAHGDIQATQSSKLRKEYSADRIIAKLDELNPEFYPRPVTESAPTPPLRAHFIPRLEGFLTKAELPVLVGKCGDVLHRGSIKKLLSGNMPIETKFTDVAKWADKIIALLNIHYFRVFDGDEVYLCTMKSAEDERVHVIIAQPKKEAEQTSQDS